MADLLTTTKGRKHKGQKFTCGVPLVSCNGMKKLVHDNKTTLVFHSSSVEAKKCQKNYRNIILLQGGPYMLFGKPRRTRPGKESRVMNVVLT